MKFEELGLRAELLRALSAKGYDTPTPIQAQAIPEILAGHDVMGGAQTGTGKTAAFALPILQLLAERTVAKGAKRPRALILTPTRELAAQVGESFRNYGKHLPISGGIVFGGVGFAPQVETLKRGIDVLVATPGRLLDHASQRTVDLSGVEILVLDEADRMLDMGFIHDIRRVIKLLPAKRQNLLFSATYTEEIKGLADGLLHKPALIEVARRSTAAELVEQIVHHVSATQKRAMLAHLVRKGDWRQVLVFVRTKHGADRLARQLEQDGISTTAIHGNKAQGARTKALADFKNGKIRVLVATDVASRGLDINLLPHVVNFDLPHVPEDYVHRIGRTGRAGSNGVAVSLVSIDEYDQLNDIERLLRKRIPVEEVEGFVAPPRSAESHVPSGSGRPSHRPGGRPQHGRAQEPVFSNGPRKAPTPKRGKNVRRGFAS